MIIKFVQENDKDYPLIMFMVKNRSRYDVLKIDDTYFIPLSQVIDIIRRTKED